MVYELLTAIYGEWISRILLEHVNTRVIYCYPENLTGMLYMDKNVCNAIYTNVHKWKYTIHKLPKVSLLPDTTANNGAAVKPPEKLILYWTRILGCCRSQNFAKCQQEQNLSIYSDILSKLFLKHSVAGWPEINPMAGRINYHNRSWGMKLGITHFDQLGTICDNYLEEYRIIGA